MLEGKCHCGEVCWILKMMPKSITACNCAICRRYGVLWAYGFAGHDIQVTGKTNAYKRQDGGDILFHFCFICGCVTHHIARAQNKDGYYNSAVNIRLSDNLEIMNIPIRHFDGENSFKEIQNVGLTVKDVWF